MLRLWGQAGLWPHSQARMSTSFHLPGCQLTMQTHGAPSGMFLIQYLSRTPSKESGLLLSIRTEAFLFFPPGK